MKFVADLHLHSHYSRATSKNLNFEHLTKWAQLKGVNVVGTGDIAHPGWLQEMKDKLEPAEEGLYRLKDEHTGAIQKDVPTACQAPVRFMLAGEISSIYKKNDKVRKIHNVIFASTLEAVEKTQAALEKIGNIRSDGRPILGLDSRDLLEIILDIDEQNYLIPAHIWTPWFALLGSKSGFDSVEECFNDLTPHIFALETGLSSDPPMNWRVSALDRYTLVSNSDAHSPPKLAREANLFDTELSYPAIFDALKTGDPDAFLGTIEFFPEEGKYHYDGHRKCGISWEPQTTLAHAGLCAVCGKRVTVGVMHRVSTLADRAEGEMPKSRHPFHSLIPLPEILSEVHQVGPNSKRVQQNYELLLSKLGSELSILRDVPLEAIAQAGGTLLAEGIRRVRSGDVTIAAGYDGEYGVIKLFDEQERDVVAGQMSFLGAPENKSTPEAQPAKENATLSGPDRPDKPDGPPKGNESTPAQWTQVELFEGDNPPPAQVEIDHPLLAGLNPQQREAVLCLDRPLIIIAGPGTGKTRTLTYRIAYLIAAQGVSPDSILAITFTNKATTEMADRLTVLVGPETGQRITIKTFHAFGTMILRQEAAQAGLDPAFSISSEQDRRTLLKQIEPDLSERDINQYLEAISAAKNDLLTPDSVQLGEQHREDPAFLDLYQQYEVAIRKHQMLDFDDLILHPVRLLETAPDLRARLQERFRWISVDEYQDINLAQYRLIRLLTGPNTNLCAIGDPDQAIYGFRGARLEYFWQFHQDLPEAKRLHLDQNYRSTQLILEASGQVIAKSPETERMEIWSEFLDKTRLEVYQAPTDKAEAEYAVHEIEKMVGGTSYFSIDSQRVADDDDFPVRSFADFAVLYRLRAQSHLLIEAFQRSGIPFQTVGQTPLTEYKEVRAMLACLWFLNNAKATFQLAQIASKRQVQVLASFLNELRGTAGDQSVPGLIEQIAPIVADQAGLRFDESNRERIEQLRLRAIPFENRLQTFLESTALQKETDLYDPRADRVTLMTLHASKGLEFPVVFIVGCEEGLLPYQRSDETPDIEEERRLFYVGMTRAQQRLILTHTKSRYLFGQPLNNPPSRFLDDIEQALKEIRASSYRKLAKDTPDHMQLKLF
jgi:DNA helicase-2/ATP-dependent DNA helicase PcrA